MTPRHHVSHHSTGVRTYADFDVRAGVVQREAGTNRPLAFPGVGSFAATLPGATALQALALTLGLIRPSSAAWRMGGLS